MKYWNSYCSLPFLIPPSLLFTIISDISWNIIMKNFWRLSVIKLIFHKITYNAFVRYALWQEKLLSFFLWIFLTQVLVIRDSIMTFFTTAILSNKSKCTWQPVRFLFNRLWGKKVFKTRKHSSLCNLYGKIKK